MPGDRRHIDMAAHGDHEIGLGRREHILIALKSRAARLLGKCLNYARLMIRHADDLNILRQSKRAQVHAGVPMPHLDHGDAHITSSRLVFKHHHLVLDRHRVGLDASS